MDLRGGWGLFGLAALLAAGLWMAAPRAIHVVREAPQSHSRKLNLGPSAPGKEVPGAAELAAAFPAIAALSSDEQRTAAIGLGAVPAPCEPCLPSRPISRCAIDHPPGCENLPALIERAASLVAAGSDEQAIILACSYGDAWIPGVSDPGKVGPVPVDLWIDLAGPFLAEIAQTVQVLSTASDALVLRTHLLGPADRAGGPMGAAAAWAADQQGLLLPFVRAVATAHGGGRAPLLDAELVAAASQISALDRARWEADRASDAATAAIARDQALAISWGVRASPTWFVNGYRMRGLQSEDALSVVIRREAVDRHVATGEIPWRR